MDKIGVTTGIEPYSPEWYRARTGTFTASEIFKLMTEPRSKKDKEAGNLSDGANTYVLQKVHEKLTGVPKYSPLTTAIEWGIENEPLATKWYGKLTGAKLIPPTLVFHETIPGFACTPDHNVGEDGLLEVKCPHNGENHFEHCFITDAEYFRNCFPKYYWQCMAQMNITGRKWCDFVSFDPRVPSDLGIFIFRLDHDTKACELLEGSVNKARYLFNEYCRLFSKGETAA